MPTKHIHSPSCAAGVEEVEKIRSEVKPSVLVSAGIELTFFLVAGTVLCFEFSMRRMLITLMFAVVAQ